MRRSRSANRAPSGTPASSIWSNTPNFMGQRCPFALMGNLAGLGQVALLPLHAFITSDDLMFLDTRGTSELDHGGGVERPFIPMKITETSGSPINTTFMQKLNGGGGRRDI